MMRRTLTSLGIALTLLLIALLAYGAGYAAVMRTRAAAEASAIALAEKERDAARVRAAKDALATLAEEEAAMRAYLLRPEDIVAFLGALERTGDARGAAVEVVAVADEHSNERPRIRIALKIQGSFDAVLRTLGTIEYGPYDSSIANVTLDTLKGDAAATGQWTATATLLIGAVAPDTL